jgi:UDP-hydrolysing UDP-N-acetyl-D-glucosamine 2-epimerase
VYSATRADFWPLAPVVRALLKDDRTEPFLIATGTHLASGYGRTIGELDALGVDVERIDTGLDADDSPHSLSTAAALGAVGVSELFERRRPDVLVVLGDRYELLGVMMVALLFGVPVAHLHGGEVTEGSTDDSVRHAVTKLAALHFCAADRYATRLRQLGEEPWRIHTTGAPALDGLRERASMLSVDDVLKTLGLELRRPLGLLTYHPPTADPERGEEELAAVLRAAERLATVVITYPGADPGADRVISRLKSWAEGRAGVSLTPSLGPQYATLLANSDVVLGNSSSGVVEAPTFGVPVLNIGDRQQGRLRAPGVLDVKGRGDDVVLALDRVLDPAFVSTIQGAANPYGDGHAAPRIVEVLATQPLEVLLRKRFVDGVT